MSSSAIGNEEAAVRLSLEKKACLDEIMKKAELFVESEEVQKKRLAVVAVNQVITVAGVLWNETTGPLTLVDKIICNECINIDFPETIPVGGGGDFAMACSEIVEALVVYSGKSEAAEVEWAWGLYFYVDTNGNTEVSVWCGPIGNFLNLNKDEIKEKIKRDGKNSYYTDVGAQWTGMSAYIYNTSPGNYALGVYYYAS